jgi:hypothetical protein
MDKQEGAEWADAQRLRERYGPRPAWWLERARKGEVRSYRIGGKFVKFKISEIEEWMGQQKA